jgi:hypothetical protein
MRKTGNFPALLLINLMIIGCDSPTTSISPPQDVAGARAPSTVTRSGPKVSLKKKKVPGISATPALIPKTRVDL